MDNPEPQQLWHYGIPGMRWGRRRPRGPNGRVNSKPSGDAARAETIKAKAKKGGKQALTNQELKDLTTRLNLEQQFDRLAPEKKSAGKQITDQVLKQVGQKATQELMNVAMKQLTKRVK